MQLTLFFFPLIRSFFFFVNDAVCVPLLCVPCRDLQGLGNMMRMNYGMVFGVATKYTDIDDIYQVR